MEQKQETLTDFINTSVTLQCTRCKQFFQNGFWSRRTLRFIRDEWTPVPYETVISRRHNCAANAAKLTWGRSGDERYEAVPLQECYEYDARRISRTQELRRRKIVAKLILTSFKDKPFRTSDFGKLLAKATTFQNIFDRASSFLFRLSRRGVVKRERTNRGYVWTVINLNYDPLQRAKLPPVNEQKGGDTK